MTLWWIGNALLAFVVAPLVIFLANRLIRQALEVRAYADDVLENGVNLTGALDAIPKLLQTKELTAVASQRVGRYGAALAAILADAPPAERDERDETPRIAAPPTRRPLRRERLTAGRDA